MEITAEIIEGCKLKKQDAFRILYSKTVPYVLSIVRTYILEESYHKDMVQEIYAHLFLQIHLYNTDKGEFKFWMRKLVVNECLRHLRKKGILFGKTEGTEQLETKISFSDNDQKTQSMNREEIEKMLKEMPKGYRIIFLLIAIDDYSHKEVGAELGITEETSRSQYLRSKQWIKTNIFDKKISKAYGLL
jgi:RNA polymerase sigma-70 factor, ECF subfamily